LKDTQLNKGKIASGTALTGGLKTQEEEKNEQQLKGKHAIRKGKIEG